MRCASLFCLVLLGCDDSNDVKVLPPTNQPAGPLEVTWLKPVPGLTTSTSMTVAHRDVVIHFEGRDVKLHAVSATFYQKKGVLAKVELQTDSESAQKQKVSLKDIDTSVKPVDGGNAVLTFESTLQEYR